MRLMENSNSKDPAVNLALEEFLMRRIPGGDPVLLFYVNDPAAVIGRNQVPYVEIGFQEVARQRAVVVRRASGGGTVYHGPGNLNFCLIEARADDPFPSPHKALGPVVNCLRALGMPARLNERHDIVVEGFKVTGTAQFRAQGRCLTHGTLLVSADLGAMQRLLAPDCDVPSFRGRRSIPSAVTNLTRYCPALTTARVRDALVEAFAASHGPLAPLSLEPGDWAAIRDTAQSRYRSWEWSVGRSPEFWIRRRAGFSWGCGEALIRIQRGIMTRIDLRLPGGAPPSLASWAAGLEGARYHPREIVAAVRTAGPAPDRPTLLLSLAHWLCPPWLWWG